MTNNEAISRIKFLLDVGGSDGFTISEREALNTAINTLSEPKTTKTNGDRIRQMTDEELAEFFDKVSDCQTCIDNPSKCHMECIDSRLEWLKEVNEDAGTAK